MIEKTVFNALPDRERGDDALVEGQAEGMVKGVWEAVIGQI